MKKIIAFIFLNLIINASCTTAKESNQQKTYIYYNMSKNSNHGMHRLPMKSSNLPLTWLEERQLHFTWQANEPNVSICIIDEKGQTILYKEETGVKGEETIINVSNLEKGEYTLIMTASGCSNFAVLKL